MKRELTEEHRAMRRGLLWLAAGAVSSVTTGMIGVGLGFGEGVFFAFATIAMATAGLALLFVEHITVAGEEAEEPEIVFRPMRLSDVDKQLVEAEREINERICLAIAGRL